MIQLLRSFVLAEIAGPPCGNQSFLPKIEALVVRRHDRDSWQGVRRWGLPRHEFPPAIRPGVQAFAGLLQIDVPTPVGDELLAGFNRPGLDHRAVGGSFHADGVWDAITVSVVQTIGRQGVRRIAEVVRARTDRSVNGGTMPTRVLGCRLHRATCGA